MLGHRGTVIAALSAIVPLLFWTAPASAEHLDKPEIRKIVRHVEERTDELQDHVDEWLGAGHDERLHRLEEFNHRADQFETDLSNFKVQVLSHDEPWDLRDQAQSVIDSAMELGHVIVRGEFSPEMRHSWDDMRDQLNDLARHYHIPEIGHE